MSQHHHVVKGDVAVENRLLRVFAEGIRTGAQGEGQVVESVRRLDRGIDEELPFPAHVGGIEHGSAQATDLDLEVAGLQSRHGGDCRP